MSKLVIVESPTKAKTIRGYLPKDYKVEASMGHIRDLPASASEVPAKYKGESWSTLGVHVENDFTPLYVVSKEKKKVVTKLKGLLADVDELILATDEDREGESIGWHLHEVLKPKVPVKRMVFHEITQEAIHNALQDTREINQSLVQAQETRRILDRLVGYTVSPLLWRKIASKLSAGRVQSVAVRLLVLRERERRAFHSGTYWDLKAQLNKQPDQPKHHFEAQLVSVDGVRVASGRDFDEATGRIAEGKNVLLLDKAASEALQARLRQSAWQVTAVEPKDSSRSPAPPFTTSTLQQESNRKIGMGAKETMRTAQTLYENGYITYMRTDSVHLSDQAINAARQRVTELYGANFLTDKPRHYKTKAKSAQEAHEAIRPAGDKMLPADQLPISGRERQLYDLIWKRTVATQMANARLRFTTVSIAVDNALFRASGRTVLFPGFFRAYVEGSDDPEAALDDQDTSLPELNVDEVVDCRDLDAIGHETKPPARYTEASLVKALESESIGRPSTYASIIDTIQRRGYAFKQRKELVPTFTAFAVIQLMEEHFHDLVDLKFTANMEQRLDDIAAGETNWLEYLNQFYLGQAGLENQVQEKFTEIDPREVGGIKFEGLTAEVRIGQYGPYIQQVLDGETFRASLPSEIPPADLTNERIQELISQKSDGPTSLGVQTESGLDVFLKNGPYGPYVQLGEDGQNGKKPKRVSLKGLNIEMADVDLPLALQLLDLPRGLGQHPETDKKVNAGIGRFGPYVLHDKKYASIKPPDSVLEIGLDRAVELLAAKKKGSTQEILKDLGEHPDGGPLQVLNGRYGPYIKYKRTNATLPKDVNPVDVTLEQAVTWVAEKQAKKPGAKKSTAKKSTAKKPAKKSTAKKPAAKKPAAKKDTDSIKTA